MRLFIPKILFLLLISISYQTFAGKLKGTVTDKESGEPLIGAVVVLENTQFGTTSGLDGSYIINNLPAGRYKIKVRYTGYEALEVNTDVEKDEVKKLNLRVASKNITLKNVTVIGKYTGGSEEEALNKEKNSNVISNIVSAKAIQISPDVTVATVVQRVSGVSIISNASGDGQYAIIRGMDKRYNTTLVNGVKIPSPDNRDRFVPLDMFPSELVERLEVNKTLTPSMEGDASGGVINIVMKDAPDRFICSGKVGLGYNDMWQYRNSLAYDYKSANRKSPEEIKGAGVYATMADFPYDNLITHNVSLPINSTASVTIGNRFFNKRLGVIASGSYQNNYNGYNSFSFEQSPTVKPAASVDSPLRQTFSDLNVRQYSTLSKRLGLMTKIDYNVDNNNSLSLFFTYLQLNEFRVMQTADSQLGGAYLPSGYVANTAIHNKIQTRSTYQSIYNLTLQGKDKLTKFLTSDWSLVASEAKKSQPDIAQFSYSEKNNPDPQGNSHYADPVVSSLKREWLHNTDKDLAAYINLHIKTGIIPGLGLIDIGGLFRHKDRDNYDNAYTGFVPVTDPNSVTENYTSLEDSKFALNGNYALGNAAGNAGIYTFHENVIAYYIQTRYEISSKFYLLGGVRVENTNAGYVSSLPVTVAGKTADFIYTDILPSLQAKYSINEKSALRASYFKSIYRPAFSDLLPFVDNSVNDDYGASGNPDLKHTEIDNVDVRYELFPKGLDQIMVGAFYKYIKNPIEYALVSTGFTEQQIIPNNFGNAQNYGLELVARKYFGSFGISANYTYTKSEITTSKKLYYLDANGGATINSSVNQTRPLQNQANHIANLSFLYKSRGRKNKIEAQLAFVYVGKRIFSLSPYPYLDTWEKPTLNMDFSIQKGFGKRFIVFIKANNLLNTGRELYIDQPNQAYNKLRYQESKDYITVQRDYKYTSYSVGIRFKL